MARKMALLKTGGVSWTLLELWWFRAFWPLPLRTRLSHWPNMSYASSISPKLAVELRRGHFTNWRLPQGLREIPARHR